MSTEELDNPSLSSSTYSRVPLILLHHNNHIKGAPIDAPRIYPSSPVRPQSRHIAPLSTELIPHDPATGSYLQTANRQILVEKQKSQVGCLDFSLRSLIESVISSLRLCRSEELTSAQREAGETPEEVATIIIAYQLSFARSPNEAK